MVCYKCMPASCRSTSSLRSNSKLWQSRKNFSRSTRCSLARQEPLWAALVNPRQKTSSRCPKSGKTRPRDTRKVSCRTLSKSKDSSKTKRRKKRRRRRKRRSNRKTKKRKRKARVAKSKGTKRKRTSRMRTLRRKTTRIWSSLRLKIRTSLKLPSRRTQFQTSD